MAQDPVCKMTVDENTATANAVAVFLSNKGGAITG